MRLSLPALNAAQILIANKPEMGVESQVFVSPVEVVRLGKIVVDAAGVAAWTPEPGASLGNGMDIHLKVGSGFTATAAPSITLTGTLADDTAGTAVAALVVPSWVPDQSKTFQEGFAVDFIPAGAGNSAKLVKAISSAAITNVPANTEFTVFGSPASSNFVELGWKRGAEGRYNTPNSVSFADGYNPSAAVKPGRPEVPELTLSFAHIAASYGLGHYNGRRVSVLLKVKKNKSSVHVSNILYTGYVPSASPNRGDGNDEVVETSTGPFEDCMQFDAV